MELPEWAWDAANSALAFIAIGFTIGSSRRDALRFQREQIDRLLPELKREIREQYPDIVDRDLYAALKRSGWRIMDMWEICEKELAERSIGAIGLYHYAKLNDALHENKTLRGRMKFWLNAKKPLWYLDLRQKRMERRFQRRLAREEEIWKRWGNLRPPAVKKG